MAVALVTGSSAGLGLSIARALASRKHGVLLVARSGDALKKHCDDIGKEFGVTADFLALDLATSEAPAAVYNWVAKGGHSVDILVNNAGFGFWGSLPDLPE